jgi:hypothetical protein
MTIRTFVAAGLMLAAGQAVADEYDCHDVVGTPGVELHITTAAGDENATVVRAAVQVKDDIGYATDSKEPTALVTVTDATVTGDTLHITLHQKDSEVDFDAAEIYLATLWSGVYPMTSGVLSLEGGGLWTMNCKVEYEAQGWQ